MFVVESMSLCKVLLGLLSNILSQIYYLTSSELLVQRNMRSIATSLEISHTLRQTNFPFNLNYANNYFDLIINFIGHMEDYPKIDYCLEKTGLENEC
jgi:hypothetical protein